MSDCESKIYDNILIQACKANKHTNSELSAQTVRRSALEKEYKKELDKHLPEIFGSSKQDASNILQINSAEENNEATQGAVAVVNNNAENSVIQITDFGALAQNTFNAHNEIVSKLGQLKVITTFTTNKEARLGEVLDNFIQNLDESSGISGEAKAQLLAQESEDVDDIDYALTQKFKDIYWETGVAFNQLPDLLFAPKSYELKQISNQEVTNLLGFTASNNLLIAEPLPGESSTTTESVE